LTRRLVENRFGNAELASRYGFIVVLNDDFLALDFTVDLVVLHVEQDRGKLVFRMVSVLRPDELEFVIGDFGVALDPTLGGVRRRDHGHVVEIVRQIAVL
jgi:hypothetical protein